MIQYFKNQDGTIGEPVREVPLTHKQERVLKLYAQLSDIYLAKNRDYGDSFNKGMDEFGQISALVRMSDKFNRIKNLMLNNQHTEVADERLTDTLLDLANYCVMTAAYILD